MMHDGGSDFVRRRAAACSCYIATSIQQIELNLQEGYHPSRTEGFHLSELSCHNVTMSQRHNFTTSQAHNVAGFQHTK